MVWMTLVVGVAGVAGCAGGAVEVERREPRGDQRAAVLVREEPRAPSLGCPTGGLDVRTGLDDDGDGALQDGEIDRTTSVCGAQEVWEGDFTARDWADPQKVAALQGVRVIDGSLEIAASGALPLLELVVGDVTSLVPPQGLALPALRTILGDATVGTGESPLRLPVLAEVGGTLYAFAWPGGDALELPEVATVGGDLKLHVEAGGHIVLSTSVALQVHGELLVSGDCSEVEAPGLTTVEGAALIWDDAYGALSLPGLQTIGGRLEVRGAPSGLRFEHLTSIGGGVSLGSSASAMGLGLPALQTIGGSLTALSAPFPVLDLPQLTSVRGDVVLKGFYGSRMTRISLPRVTRIGGRLEVGWLPELTTIDLGSLVTVAGALWILEVPALATLSLSSLDTVGGLDASDMITIENTALEAIDWPLLRVVRGYIQIFHELALQRVRLPQLTTAAGLEAGGPLLAEIVAPRLTGAARPWLRIYGPIQTLDLGALGEARDVWIGGAALLDLSGLRSLGRVEQLLLSDLPQLQDLRGLASLQQVAELTISRNAALTSLDGLEGVSALTGSLTLQGNRSLASVAGLRNVTAVRASLVLEDNPALADLAFSALTSLDGPLRIQHMAGLSSLSGLGALSSVTGEIIISDNSSLPEAEVQALLARLGR